MMLSFLTLAPLLVAFSAVSAAPQCTTQQRVKSSLQVGVAYNAKGLGASAAAFQLVPWGAPDRPGTCLTSIIPNGLDCAIPVATTGQGTYNFAVATRQLFHNLTVTEVKPFNNGTVLLSVEIEIGAREFVPVPVTFHGYVYMDYNAACRIYAARAYADIPTSVLGLLTQFGVPGNGAGPVCNALPKREVEAIEAVELEF